MLENIIKKVEEFKTDYDRALSKLKEEIDFIQKNYNSSGTIFTDKMAEIRARFNDTVETARVECIREIQNCALQAQTLLAEITSQPAPTDAVATIELLKSGAPETASEFEVKAILNKYKDSYLASKLIVQLTRAEKRFGIVCTPADELVKDIKEIETMAYNFIRQYSGQLTYRQRLTLKGTYLENINKSVQNFLNFEFVKEVPALVEH